jgi:hypothetical protein
MWIAVDRRNFEAANLATSEHGHRLRIRGFGEDPGQALGRRPAAELVALEAHPDLARLLGEAEPNFSINWFCLTGIARLAAA